MVSELRDPIVQELSNLFEFEVAFNDPGVSHFGLENAVIPIGTDFLEVVSPVEDNTRHRPRIGLHCRFPIRPIGTRRWDALCANFALYCRLAHRR